MHCYTAQVRMLGSEIDRINKLLSIESLEEMTDEELSVVGAEKDSCFGVYCAAFEDGSEITFDLCSGQHNYYDDVVWHSNDGSCEVNFDCEFELGSLEVEVFGDQYKVIIERM